jgi:gamma-tubulin complex component 2
LRAFPLMSCVVSQVIEPHWREMEAALHRAHTADDLLSAHTNFLDTCLTECLLSSPVRVSL